MSEKILVPALGESITEATVAKWLKNAGDVVEADEPIVELETDKVNLEVPSPVKGVLTEIHSKDGSVVEVGALLGSVSEGGSSGLVKKEEPIQSIKTQQVFKPVVKNLFSSHVKRGCEWPEGHPDESDFKFCGKDRFEDKPYCLDHCEVAYVIPEKEEIEKQQNNQRA